MSASRTTYSVLAQALAEQGVSHVFGLLGHGNFLLVNELVQEHAVRYVAVNREDSAVGAADAYARVSGQLGVATVTHGPGLTNTITALHEATRARTPLLLLVGDTDRSHRTHEQDIDQQATVMPTKARFVELRGGDTAGQDFSLAVGQALEQRRPVVFNMPVDLQNAYAKQTTSDVPLPRHEPVTPNPDVLDRALGVLAVARRPIVIAGRGAIEANARDQILRLADLLNAPVATTLMARGLFSGHPFNLGVFGTLSSPPAIEAISQADCLIAFGASLNRYTTSYGGFTAEKQVIQVDSGADALGSRHPVDVGIHGDAQLTSAQMVGAFQELGETPPGIRSESLAESLRKHNPETEFTDLSSRERLDPRTLMIWLNDVVPRDRTVVTDVGGFLRTALRYLDALDPRATVVPGNFGAIGLGMGCSIGAGMAKADRPVIAVVGDGGFMMGGIAEFETAVRYDIDLIAVVMNNAGYEIERTVLRDSGCEPSLATMPWPDFARVARSVGGRGTTIRRPGDLADAEAMIADRKGPLLIDAHITST